MKLRKLRLENFRGYGNFEITFSNNLNVIIGKNDVGKSTILEALEIFFNNEIVKLDLDDLKVGSNGLMSITAMFEVDPNKEYLIDSERKTSLIDEYLLNIEGLLEIKKEWNCTDKKNLPKNPNIYIVSNYFKEFKEKPLITLKITDLKNICKEKGLDEIVKDKRVLSELRKAIYSNISNKELEIALIPIDKEESKKVYERLSNDFPIFSLFQSDRQNKDSDKEVQDPLKIITKQAIYEYEKELSALVSKIEDKVIKKGNETIAKLREINAEIANELIPNVKNKNWDSLFSFSFTGDDGIPINKRGSGVRRLIILSYFRAEAEEKAGNSREVIYALEEPETSQHPDHQIILINSLIKLANYKNKQVIITTHSPEIAKMCNNKSLILLKKDKDGSRNIICNTESKILEIRQTLGIMPYLSKLVICVEGEHDVDFLRNINKNIPEIKNIFDLETNNISIIPLNGGNLKNWVERDYLRGSNIIEFHIYDKDSNSGKNTEQYLSESIKINERPDKSCATLTNKKELENYVHREIYEKHFKIDFSTITDWDNFDIPKYISNKIQMPEKKIKSIINGRLSKYISKTYLEQLNAYDEVKGWFEKMKELYE